MRHFWNRIRDKWANWCGDRDMEIAIRKHLDEKGVYGRTARLQRVRVVAMKRPGWIQIYRFEAIARVVRDEDSDGEIVEERFFFGLVHDDGRALSKVVTFASAEERAILFREWSDGMICLRGTEGLL